MTIEELIERNRNRIDDTTDLSKFLRPDYYKAGGIECIEYIMDKKFNFCLGNVIKYVTRAGQKGDALEDLKKARQYLDFEIERLEREKNGQTAKQEDDTTQRE